MTLDLYTAAFLRMLDELGAPSTFEGTPDEMRARMEQAITSNWNEEALAPVDSVTAERVGAENTPVLIVRPRASENTGSTVVFFHPGGFVLGSAELFRDICQRIAHKLGAVVVGVSYRRAPEQPFPAAVLDAVAVTEWAIENAESLGGDRDRVAVAGESSGANLATVAALHMRDRGRVLAAQLLSSPYTDLTLEFPSVRENSAGYFFTERDTEVIRASYLRADTDAGEPDASPARARLDSVAPAIIGVAGYDPLRDDGIVYAAELLKAGVPTWLRVYPSLIHPFFTMPGLSDDTAKAGDELLALLGDAINDHATRHAEVRSPQ